MNADLRSVLVEQLEAVAPPPGDLEGARADGRRLRRRRQVAVTGVAGIALVAATAGLGSVIRGDDRADRVVDSSYAALGTLDFSQGARAYADPDTSIHLGGRRFPYGKLGHLDTDAVATEHGIVFFDRGRPMLLNPSGLTERLVDGPLDHDEQFHPTAKVDALQPLVAWGTLPGGIPTLTVRDLTTGKDVATAELVCGRCADVVIDGIDDGVVFVRDRDGTRTWDTSTGAWLDFAGPRTRVADVRNGVVLYAGPPPDHPGPWRVVAGAIDAQLTLDGSHVLSWSSTLAPTDPAGRPIVLAQGPRTMGDGFGWYAIDTDGSVLVATGKDYPHFTVYDCELADGSCDKIGEMQPASGDPMFIGVDM